MIQSEQSYSGTLRIKNPKTLERWKKDGRFKELIDEGYIYAKGCGRFRVDICTCSKCRSELKNKTT
jgi:hypothetical protein